MKTSVLIADDHGIIREGVAALLQRLPQFSVVGLAANGRDALALARSHAPDIAVLDVSMPDMNGIETTRMLAVESPSTRVLALSMHEDRQYVSHMMAAGARGYLLKECVCEELVGAIATVLAGKLYFSAKLSSKLRDMLVCEGDPLQPSVHLTSRESQTLQLLAEGNTTKAIAAKLNVSTRSVDTYRRSLMDKYNVSSVAELTKVALREGVTSV